MSEYEPMVQDADSGTWRLASERARSNGHVGDATAWAAEGRAKGYPVAVGAPLPVDIEGFASWIERRPNRLPETTAEMEERLRRSGITEGEKIGIRRMHGYTIGTRTAADLLYGTPPAQLVDAFLTPEGSTLLYAKGGTGKGITACYLIRRLVQADHVVMVIDYEGHEREWGSRLRGLGMTDDELARVHYRAPFGGDWTAPSGALAAVADAIREDCDRLGVTYIVVDSYTMATTNGDTMGGEQAAREYFGAQVRIGRPNLTIAHVRGDSDRFPSKPFGSVFVHNLARETWAAEAVGDRTPDTDPDLIRFGPNIVELELRNMKHNGRAKSPPQFLAFSFHADDTITVSTDRRGARLADMADAVLAEPMTLRQIAAAIAEDYDEKFSEDVIGKAMRRAPTRFRSTDERPRKWGRSP